MKTAHDTSDICGELSFSKITVNFYDAKGKTEHKSIMCAEHSDTLRNLVKQFKERGRTKDDVKRIKDFLAGTGG